MTIKITATRLAKVAGFWCDLETCKKRINRDELFHTGHIQWADGTSTPVILCEECGRKHDA